MSSSGGSGGQIPQPPQPGGETFVGGGGHLSCDASGSCTDPIGGSGQHVKGPGGNSD